MKFIRVFAVLLVISIFSSCSSDESSGSSNPKESFTYKLNNLNVPIVSWTAVRTENFIEVLGIASDGSSIYASFDKFGHFERIGSTSPVSSSIPWRDSFYEFSSNYFNFELVSLDETNKTVKVNFSGKLYEDMFDLSSSSSSVEGNFYVKYVDQPAPEVTGLGTSLKINGTNWRSIKESQTDGFFSGSDITLTAQSDDAYAFGLTINHNNTQKGTYNFTPSTTVNKVVLSKYDPLTNSYVDFAGTGTLVITDKIVGSQYTIIKGTYVFNAKDPKTNISTTITEGAFKTIYENY